MAIAFDAASSTSGNSSSFSWSHTCSGSDRLLVVQIGIQNGAEVSPITAVTYNGVALTLQRRDYVTYQVVAETWTLVAPATGANNVQVTLSGADKMAMGAISLTGVDQSTPVGAKNGYITSSGTGGPQSISLTTSYDNSWIVEFCCVNDPQQPSVNSGQTSRWAVNTTGSPAAGNSGARGATQVATTPGGYTCGYNWTSTVKYGIQAIEIREVGATGNGRIMNPSSKLW